MIVYDIETYPNCFLLGAISLDRDDMHVFEISDRQNDSYSLFEWLAYLRQNQVSMIGYNNLAFDYVVLHHMIGSSIVSPNIIAEYASDIIQSQRFDRFGRQVWQKDRYIPQIDLLKLWHFDNKAKTQSLKGLQFNMRSASVQDLPIDPGTHLTADQMQTLVEYNKHDVLETRKFAHISLPAIKFRESLSERIYGDILNFNDTKLGKELLIQRLGENVCYTRSNGRREPRQTIRTHIPLSDVVFPYIQFRHPEFQRIHQWMLSQTLGPSDYDDTERASTKGVFSGVNATINGFTFHFGTGGIHGSIERRVMSSDETHVIIDADVASLYPSIAIVNRLYPEHLGELFIAEYAALKDERFKHKKGTPENSALKLALNGSYGASNDIYSPLYDPLFTMRITINGQLMLCMLAEWLLTEVAELEIIQINTDGITVKIPRSARPVYETVCKQWEKFTCLDLEFVDYQTMWIRDVNNYIAQDTKGKLKLKGAYWYPVHFPDDITNAGPPAWHKDLSAPIIQQAAVFEMVHGLSVEQMVITCIDPFMFMLRAKATRGSTIYIGDQPQQRVTRYYVSHDGEPIYKVSPPVENATPGAYKKKNGVEWGEYHRIMAELPADTWDERIHTANKSRYEDRKTDIVKGHVVRQCNNVRDFDWNSLNLQYYIDEARKLVI